MRPVTNPRATGLISILLLASAVGCGRTDVTPGDDAGGTEELADVYIVDVVAGDEHSCALNHDGRAWCWGRGKAGRTGPPVAAARLAAGSYHTCALTQDGQPRCWGQIYWDTPAEPRFVELCGGRDFACGRDGAGAVRCWGEGEQEPPPDAPFVVAMQRLTCGVGVVCGVDGDDEFVCWHPDSAVSFAPAPVSVVDLDIRHHACGITELRELVCWGDAPEVNPPAGQFKAVGVGLDFTCALTLAGEVRCWGDDEWAVLDAPPGHFTRLAVGRSHSCALREDGRVLCWGQSQDCFWHGEPMDDCSLIPPAIGEVHASADQL
jgi:hypothetical protein